MQFRHALFAQGLLGVGSRSVQLARIMQRERYILDAEPNTFPSAPANFVWPLV